MGYDYYFLIGLADLPKDLKSMNSEDLDKELEQNVYPNFMEVYKTLSYHDWFPKFGELESSGSLGYGCGPNDHLLPELKMFTTCFPEFTFHVYLFYWDCSMIYCVSIKDSNVIDAKYFDRETVVLEPFRISSKFNIIDTDIPNNITHYFNTEYDNGHDIGWCGIIDSQ
jgi:hypothetical protein